jgi:signal transduction histidine kinase
VNAPSPEPALQGVARLRSEQARFRRRILEVAGTAMAVLGPVFALSEWSAQTLGHNLVLLSLTPSGLVTLLLARQGRANAAVAALVLGAIPVVSMVHLFGERGQFSIFFFVPVLVMGMLASEGRAARGVPIALALATLGIRAVRLQLGIDTDWNTWLTQSFDAVAVIALAGVMTAMGQSRVARDEAILSRALTDVERLAEAARNADHAKSAFLARMSHELRTPLNAILGYTELLQEEEAVDPTYDADLGRIHTSSHQLLRLIDDVLDLSKVEAGKLELNRTYVDLEAMLEEVRSTAHPLVRRNQNTLVVDRSGPSHAWLDRTRIIQVLLNLLSNAARFTERGTITLRARAEPGLLVFEVQDTGIGIEADRMGVLFQPFVQVSPRTAGEYGGTGLGLALCDRFVRQMGGHIDAQSTPGVGSRFRVTVPLRESEVHSG